MLWLLFVIALKIDGPKTAQAVFTSEAECKTAQVEITTMLLKDGVQKGSVTCTKINIGEFS